MDGLAGLQWELDEPLHVGGGEVVGVHAPVKLLHFAVIRFRPLIHALEMDAEQGTFVVQHPEAVPLVKADAVAAQLVFGGIVGGGGLHLAEDLTVAFQQQGQGLRPKAVVPLAPEDAQIFQQPAVPRPGQPHQRVAQRIAVVVSDQQGIVLPHVHEPKHGPQGLEFRPGKVVDDLGVVKRFQFTLVQQLQFHVQTPKSLKWRPLWDRRSSFSGGPPRQSRTFHRTGWRGC